VPKPERQGRSDVKRASQSLAVMKILNSPVQEYGPHHGATSGFTAVQSHVRPSSPIMDDPSEELERELAGTHLGTRR